MLEMALPRVPGSPRSASPLSKRGNRSPEAAWGIYLYICTLFGFLPLFYRGSATESEFGIRRRVDEYGGVPVVSAEIAFQSLAMGLDWLALLFWVEGR